MCKSINGYLRPWGHGKSLGMDVAPTCNRIMLHPHFPMFKCVNFPPKKNKTAKKYVEKPMAGPSVLDAMIQDLEPKLPGRPS